MNPEQALKILDTAASRAPLNRDEHVAVQQAKQVLAKLIPAEPEDTPE